MRTTIIFKTFIILLFTCTFCKNSKEISSLKISPETAPYNGSSILIINEPSGSHIEGAPISFDDWFKDIDPSDPLNVRVDEGWYCGIKSTKEKIWIGVRFLSDTTCLQVLLVEEEGLLSKGIPPRRSSFLKQPLEINPHFGKIISVDNKLLVDKGNGYYFYGIQTSDYNSITVIDVRKSKYVLKFMPFVD